MDLETISVLTFFLLISLLLWRDRKSVIFKYGFVIRKWKSGLKKIDKFIQRHPKLLNYFGLIGVIVSLALSFLTIYY
ncbi:MAG: hypothetical protein J7L39_04235, partial [Candidatus Aenigmarchaeota archaeon]|nr:hypothetical protein [Candidatus Aenigmarchaeota archaeon]